MPKPLDIKPSKLDLQAPSDVTVMYRITTIPERMGYSRVRPPTSLGDYDNAEAAKARSAELTKQKCPHTFLTWWRKDGRHVQKWGTLMRNKHRNFKVRVPFVQGFSDSMIRQCLLYAILSYPEKPDAYVETAITVRPDADANRTEVMDTLNVLLPPDVAARVRLWPAKRLGEVLAAALRDIPDEEPPYL